MGAKIDLNRGNTLEFNLSIRDAIKWSCYKDRTVCRASSLCIVEAVSTAEDFLHRREAVIEGSYF
jgi:hypothetical protein